MMPFEIFNKFVDLSQWVKTYWFFA